MRLGRLAAVFLGFAACSKSGPEGPDTITLKADKTTIAADQIESATITITVSNSDSKPLPAAIKVTITAAGTSGFLETSGTESEDITLAADSGTAHFFCAENAAVAIKATISTPSGDTANKTIDITCGTGPSTGATSGGGGATDKSAITLSATPSPVNQSGTVAVTATVTDIDGSPIADGTEVIFSTTFGIFGTAGSTASVTTSGGKGIAATTLTAPADSGDATITANFTDSTSTIRTASTTVEIVDPSAYSIKVTATTTDLPTIGASTTITATLYCGQAPSSGSFDVSLIGPANIGTFSLQTPNGTVGSDGRSITSAATAAGDVIVDFTSGAIGGAALVTFTFAGTDDCQGGGNPETFTGNLALTIDRPPQLTSAQFVSVDNNTIRVKGSIAPNTAMLTFKFTDQLGGNAADGIPVTFALSPNHSQDVFLTPSATVTAGGAASTFLNAGGQAETITVTASATQNGVTVSATSTSIAIVGGIPEYSHMSISCDPNTIVSPGLAFDGLETTCTVQMADRFSNRVDVGTEVDFRTEAGSINNALTFDEVSSIVQPIVRSSSPRPRKFLTYYDKATRANPTGSAVRGKDYASTPLKVQEFLATPFGGMWYPDGSEVIATNFYPNDGVDKNLEVDLPLLRSRGQVTFIAVTQGEESFVDLNGNKVYDKGEPFIDLQEPFIDKNDNGVQDSCTDTDGNRLINETTGLPLTDDEYYACYEDFIDLNGNGKWDDGNGVWDNYTAIWKPMTVTWTDTPVGFLRPDGASTNKTPCVPGASPNTSTYVSLFQTAHLYSGDPSTDTCRPSDALSTFTAAEWPGVNFVAEVSDQNYNCAVTGQYAATVSKNTNISGNLNSVTSVLPFIDSNCGFLISILPGTSAPTATTDYAGALQLQVDVPSFLSLAFGWGMGLDVP